MRQLQHQYKLLEHLHQLPRLDETGFRVFSQFEEDGLLHYIFCLIGCENRLFVDLGSHDGVNSNCANLVVHLGWHGLFVDADRRALNTGRAFYKKYPDRWSPAPLFCEALLTPENVNTVIGEAQFSGSIDLLSIDIDGHDFHIWKALTVVTPRVVIAEANVEMGLHNCYVPYNASYNHRKRHPYYHGASVPAWVALARQKGYRLIGANQYGHNLLFLRNDVQHPALPEVTAESVLQHPITRASFSAFREIEHLPLLKA